MRYGFLIDQNRCIGCHACTVACKEEHNVPIGVNRTWVKYIEKGQFPDTRRHFAVLRCNHCDAAPCIDICPTVALFRHPNGIVDFDNDRCIGCKSCMQACPYDALYIDPNSHTAAKCNFCAHRVEIGLKPSCEIVCPTQAILSGDLDDPESQISNIARSNNVTVRKPEKGTQPKLSYLGVDEDLLEPTRMTPQSSHLWGEKQQGEDEFFAGKGNQLFNPGVVREVYDAPHPQTWGRMIASYLWTKSIAAGVILIAAMLTGIGYSDERLTGFVSPILALIFTTITVGLLVFDLKRPERFFYILIKPNLGSWLVLGGYILLLFGVMAFLWLAFAFVSGTVPWLVHWLAAILAIGSAGYSAFLFAQAKGRELWQSRLFFWHLIVQAVTAGAATLILCAALLGTGPEITSALAKSLAYSLGIGVVLLMGELFLPHRSEDSRRATNLIKTGALSLNFWGLVIVAGFVLPLLFIVIPGASNESTPLFQVLASTLALIGLWVFEDLWIKAGQAVPLS